MDFNDNWDWDKFEELSREATNCYHNGEYKEALNLYTDALELAPGKGRLLDTSDTAHTQLVQTVLYNLGVTYIKLERYQSSINISLVALDIFSLDSWRKADTLQSLFFNIAYCYFRLKDYAKFYLYANRMSMFDSDGKDSAMLSKQYQSWLEDVI